MHSQGEDGDGHREGRGPVTKGSVLEAREERWNRKRSLAAELSRAHPDAPFAIASLTLRMPAPLRTSGRYDGVARSLHLAFLSGLEARSLVVLYEAYRISADGPETYVAAACSALELKQISVAIEENEVLGPLADLDVVDAEGRNIGRADLGLPPRRCLVCGEEAAPCSAGGRHGIDELEAAVRRIVARSRLDPIASAPKIPQEIGRLALTALLYEASAAPKPGLVDPLSRGAHADMDYLSFLASAAALGPWFTEFARLGFLHRGESAELLPSLRAAGIRAEAAMYAATGGVNTHKGLIFSLGLLCAAAGRLAAAGLQASKSPASPAEACASEAAAIAAGLVALDLGRGPSPDGPSTTGARLYRAEGLRGVRGEAEDGFPSVLDVGLPRLRAGLAARLSPNDAMVGSLLALCQVVEDTTVLGRRGWQGLALLRSGTASALGLGGMGTKEGRAKVLELDTLFSAESISPGGCADLLAASVFLHLLDKAGAAVL